MNRNLLPILMLLVLFSPLAIDIYLPALALMATDFSVPFADIQLTVIIFLFSMGVGQILVGPLADKFGRRPIALFGILGYGISALLGAMAQTYELILMARVLQGLSACATSIVAFSAIRDRVSDEDGPKYYSYLNGAICTIPALAPTLGGYLTLEFGWRSNFIFLLGFAVVIGLLMVKILPETQDEQYRNRGRIYHFEHYQPMLTSVRFLVYALVCMVAMAAILAYVSYAPSYVLERLGRSELEFSALFGMNAIVNLVACFIAPIYVAKWGSQRSIHIALGLIIISVVMQLVATSIWPDSSLAYMLPMMVLGCAFALLLGPATGLALAPFKQQAGTAAALLGFIQMAGAALLVAIVTQITQRELMGMVVVCAVIPSIMLAITKWEQRR